MICSLIFLFFAFSCENQTVSSQFEHKDRVINAFDIEVGEELNLSFRGIAGRANEKIEEIGLSYSVKGQATVDEAQALCIYVVEKLLKFVNEDEGIRPYLQEYPFPASRIDLELCFDDAYTYPISNTRVHQVSNKFEYLYTDYLDPFRKYESREKKELYSEAKERIEQNPIPIPIVHKNTPFEEAMDAVLPKYREEMYEQYGLWTASIGCDRGEDPQEIGTVFTLFEPATQEEARSLIVTAVESLLKRIKEYPEFNSIDANKIAMRIEFRTERYNNYRDGTLESVTLENGKLTYVRDSIWKEGDSVSDCFKPEVIIGEESYQEAVEKV